MSQGPKVLGVKSPGDKCPGAKSPILIFAGDKCPGVNCRGPNVL